MIIPFLFIVGLLNNIFLIAIFIIRKNPESQLLYKIGITYLLIFTPAAIIGVILANIEMMESYYTIFLIIFLIFLGLEALFDFILKVDFRTNWKLAVPYIILYYASNYGLIVMCWRADLIYGIILLVLFIVQILANILTHPKFKKKPTTKPDTKPNSE